MVVLVLVMWTIRLFRLSIGVLGPGEWHRWNAHRLSVVLKVRRVLVAVTLVLGYSILTCFVVSVILVRFVRLLTLLSSSRDGVLALTLISSIRVQGVMLGRPSAALWLVTKLVAVIVCVSVLLAPLLTVVKVFLPGVFRPIVMIMVFLVGIVQGLTETVCRVSVCLVSLNERRITRNMI